MVSARVPVSSVRKQPTERGVKAEYLYRFLSILYELWCKSNHFLANIKENA
jgi:hypothetical protein